jgi:hypothetical protein
MNAATTSQPENDYYSLDFKYTGLAVMINNFKFTSFLNFPKSVSDKDIESFGTLKDFNFQIEKVMLNQTKAQITEIIAKYTSFDYADYACILFCMSSHGEQNKIISSDCVGIDIQREIIEPFYKVASLNNKPKIFLFDCCRGNQSVKKEPGNIDIDIGKDNVDEKKQDEFTFGDEFSNFFFAYATIMNFVATAAKPIGSYLIATFFEVLREHGKTEDWDGLQRKVVKLMRERYIQIPIFSSNAEYKLAFVKNLEKSMVYILMFNF